jgi:subtilase family protein/fervidolysin-like protein
MRGLTPSSTGLFGALILAAPSGPQALSEVGRQVIIEIRRTGDRRAIEGRLALDGCHVVEEIPALGLLLVTLPDGASVDAAVAQLSAAPGVGFAEPNGTGEVGGFIPNDPSFPIQWPLENTGQSGGRAGADIEAVSGWGLARGSPSVFVAVLDTGLARLHPEFAGRVGAGYDFVNEDAVPNDDHNHGTLVTSILAGNADNASGLAGVDHACTILPVKVVDEHAQGTSFDLAQGLVYAADAGADVVNMSLINYPEGKTIESALLHAREAGCVLVAAAGNGGIGDADKAYPGRSPLVISVGATTKLDTRASFSGTGTRLDLVAPGREVPATSRQPVLGNDWILFSGTSAATPHVSGIAALALSIDPTLTHDEVRALLVAGAEDQVGPQREDSPGRDDYFGNGRVNLLRTLCGLDAGGPTIVAPRVVQIECQTPGGIAGDDPLVNSALSIVEAFDDLDPVPSLEVEPPAFLPLGVTLQLVFTARDACGNETQRTVEIAAVDTRAPLLELELLVAQLSRQHGLLVPVELRSKVTDACDLAPVLVLSVYADESPGNDEPDARIDQAGNLCLRAERDATGNGRVYLCLVHATDGSGNAAASCATTVVPHDRDEASLADVQRQAGHAERVCQLTGAPPPDFHLLLTAPLPPDQRIPVLRGAR